MPAEIYLITNDIVNGRCPHCATSGPHKPGQEGLSSSLQGHPAAHPLQPPGHSGQDVCGAVRPLRHAALLTGAIT